LRLRERRSQRPRSLDSGYRSTEPSQPRCGSLCPPAHSGSHRTRRRSSTRQTPQRRRPKQQDVVVSLARSQLVRDGHRYKCADLIRQTNNTLIYLLSPRCLRATAIRPTDPSPIRTIDPGSGTNGSPTNTESDETLAAAKVNWVVPAGGGLNWPVPSSTA